MKPKHFIYRKIFFLLFLFSFFASLNVIAQADRRKFPKKISRPLQPKDTPVPVPADTLKPKGPDSDGDGIEDTIDKCPDEKGVIQYDGCPMPDTDNDGIADDLDECPDVAGPIKYKGCPAGDRDGDKISDDEDKCPDVPGLARFGGCPTQDTDGDGVNDDDDKCADIPGPASNYGCPDTKEYRKLLKQQDGKKKSATPARKS